MKKAASFLITAAAVFTVASAVFAEGEPSISLVAPKFDEAIKVDGVLTDTGWVTAAARGGKTVMDINHTADAVAAYPRACYVGYDAKSLNFGFVIMSDKELTATDPGGAVWSDDSCEIFLSPDGESYGHIGVNYKGVMNTELNGDLEWDLEATKVAASSSGIAHYIEVSIPFSALGQSTPKSGTKWKINLTGHQTDGDLWITTNATYGGFHNPERFYTLTFE